MKLTGKLLNMSLVLFVNIGIISACSQQTPNTTNTNNSQSTQQSSDSSNSSIDINASVQQNTEIKDTQDSLQDDEMTARDSEFIADNQTDFQTKALTTNLSANVNAKVGATAVIKNSLTKSEREEILKDRKDILKAKINLLQDKLKIVKDITSDLKNKVARKDVYIRTSDVATVNNDDGTTTKIMTIRFENKSDASLYRENKISKTYNSDGILIRIEQIIDAHFQNYTREYTRIVDVNSDGSRKAVINSTTTWTNGRIRVLSEQRDISADRSGTATGTITITTKDGQTTTYNINTTITASGGIIIQPLPSESPSPVESVSPSPTTT